MAERTLYFSARSAETSPNNGNEIVEVVGDVTGDPMLTPIRPRRILTGEESANSSQGASTTPNSPSYLRRNDLVTDTLNMEDVAEDENEDGDGDSKASASEMEELRRIMEQVRVGSPGPVSLIGFNGPTIAHAREVGPLDPLDPALTKR